MGAAGGVASTAQPRAGASGSSRAKRRKPSLSVLLITDPINDVYGGAPLELLDELRTRGIDVVVTDLERLRDSNPVYSSLWRMFLQWWGNFVRGGAMTNPFTSERREITLRSWLALLNFKANHRKLIVADRERRHADRRWSRPRIRTMRAARTRTWRCASPARSPSTSSTARWRSRASPAGADTSTQPSPG